MHDVFIDFESLDLDDYILNFDYDIVAPIFPINRHTAGDFLRVPLLFHPKCGGDQRISTKILNMKQDENKTSKDSEKIKEKQIHETIQNTIETKLHDEVEKIVEHNSEKIIQEAVSVVESKHSLNVENHTTNNQNLFSKNFSENISIQNIINQKMEESHSMTENMIIELEQNVNLFQQEIIANEIKQINNKITQENRETKKELNEKIDSTKKFFEKFLDS